MFLDGAQYIDKGFCSTLSSIKAMSTKESDMGINNLRRFLACVEVQNSDGSLHNIFIFLPSRIVLWVKNNNNIDREGTQEAALSLEICFLKFLVSKLSGSSFRFLSK